MMRRTVQRWLLVGLLAGVSPQVHAQTPGQDPQSEKQKAKKSSNKDKAKRPAKKRAATAERMNEQADRFEERAKRLREQGKEDAARRAQLQAERLRQRAAKAPSEPGGKRLSPAEARQQRKFQRLKSWKKRYGDSLKEAPVQQELSLHARRTAKLERMKTLAQEGGKEPLLERVRKLIDKENERHEQRMGALTNKTAPASSAAPAPAEPAKEGAQ